jgi:hypothetical protein
LRPISAVTPQLDSANQGYAENCVHSPLIIGQIPES